MESPGNKQLQNLLAKEEQRLEQEQRRAAVERRRKQQQERFQLQHELNHPLRQHHAPQNTRILKGDFICVAWRFAAKPLVTAAHAVKGCGSNTTSSHRSFCSGQHRRRNFQTCWVFYSVSFSHRFVFFIILIPTVFSFSFLFFYFFFCFVVVDRIASRSVSLISLKRF